MPASSWHLTRKWPGSSRPAAAARRGRPPPCTARQTDGDADTALQHLVQEAVARIVVVLDIGCEAVLLEQEPIEPDDQIGGRCVLRDARAQSPGQLVEPAQIVLHVEVRIGELGNQQRRFGEIDVSGRAAR